MHNPGENNKELQDNDRIITFPHTTNKPFIKYFYDKDAPNFIQELKKIFRVY